MKRKFKWGAKRNKIAGIIRRIVNQKLGRSLTSFSFSTEELRRKVKKLLPNQTILSLDIINAIRKDKQLGRNLSISQQNGEEYLTFYSEEMRLAFEIVKSRMHQRNLTLVPKRAAA